MGITNKEYLENIYSILFTPVDFFKRDDIKISTRQAALTVVWVGLFSFIGQGIANNSVFNNTFFLPLLLFKTSLLLFGWFLTGLFFEYIGKIFSVENRLSKILYYTSFAAVPYIFFAPLDVLKHTSYFGYNLGVIIEILLYFWIITLYAFSLRKSYDISLARSFMLLALPFIGTFFAISWAICFFVKMGYINSI